MNLPFLEKPARSPALKPAERAARVTAVLGPTNTGKTHLAIERMLYHPRGIIGLPLRLLAREVYNRVVEKVGPELSRSSPAKKRSSRTSALLGLHRRGHAARSRCRFRRHR